MSKFKLVKPSTMEMEEPYKVIIKADSNDADYITTISTYNNGEFESIVIDALIDLLKNYGNSHQLEDYGYKWDEWNEAFDEEGNLLEGKVNFEDILEIPCSDYGRCHTLESVEVTYIDENGVLWNIEINTDDE